MGNAKKKPPQLIQFIYEPPVDVSISEGVLRFLEWLKIILPHGSSGEFCKAKGLTKTK